MRTKDLPDVEAVLAHRHDAGADFWASRDGKVGVGSPFSTVESLLILHELRVPRTHEAVAGALDQLLAGWREDGRLRVAPKGTVYPCHTTQHDDGGWRCARAPLGRSPETDRSDPGVTLNVLDALRFLKSASTSRRLGRAVGTLLEHWTVRRPLASCAFGIGTLFGQVEYPFLRYDLFTSVYVLSFHPLARRDMRYREALAELQLATARYREVLTNMEA